MSREAQRPRGILDTNTVILMEKLPSEQLPAVSLICTVTLAELVVGPLTARTEAERALRQTHLDLAEADFQPLPFDARAARAYGQVGASLRRSGRKPAARSFDAMIAAVAIANDLPLHTCNPEDFAGIEGLDLVAVRHPDRPAGLPERPAG